jgi:hypothetical protein
MKTNTQRWLKGAMSALIQGGAGALVSSGTASIIDPDKLNPMTQTLHFLELGSCVFVITGLLHLAMFLQQHPLPDDSNTAFITKPPATTPPQNPT